MPLAGTEDCCVGAAASEGPNVLEMKFDAAGVC